MTRRSFYERAVFALGGVINAALALPAVAYLLVPKSSGESDDWTDAGSVSALPGDRPSELSIRRERQDAWKTSVEEMTVWAVKKSDSDIVVYAPQCPHLGCGYHWDEQDQYFLCPCHDSAFDEDGKVLRGPAPRPLDRFETRIEGGRLWLGPIRQQEQG